jgi:DNA-binding phage protein
MTPSEIAAALRDRNLTRVAENTGLHHNTVIRAKNGTVKPCDQTIAILSEYLSAKADR